MENAEEEKVSNVGKAPFMCQAAASLSHTQSGAKVGLQLFICKIIR